MSHTQQEKPLDRADEVKDVRTSEVHSDNIPKSPEVTWLIITLSHTNQSSRSAIEIPANDTNSFSTPCKS
jgi:hypothetical protein